ncbi:hypothetical protein Lesp02_11770 [Lentzea sp. NBRC 105346]|uniref:nSTAND1 domain-containing NTPase n=1 Tax=Lentzea sp. NBRC 105346 TaxID=3032205 RepID=UPI0024A5483B|nr:hypothetical protein [Lentzea sp. NBRC 105346]GLZ28987.1 hypothetical protein Lesp02_11770 [Lentzea sp. NBRC 105346]
MPRPERPIDQEEGTLPAFAADLRKLREKAGKPTYRELARTAHYSVTVLAEAAGGRKLPSLAVTLAYVEACGGDAEEWRRRWQAAAAEYSSSSDDQEPPYVGLGAFQPGDADRFFGRDKLVRQLMTKVAECRFVGVFGASGSGKSSILRAGLVPRTEGEAKVITPGAHPMDEWRATDGADLVVVDQFEEVFTLCRDPQERAAFIRELVRGDTHVVIGVRSDFHGHCGQYPELVDALNDAQILVGAMSPEELYEAITQPAVRAGYTVESALVSALAAEHQALPLVSHVLLETWKRRRGTRLTLEAYEETGGVRYAIAQSAEDVYTSLEPAEQDVARRILQRLTALGDGTEDTKRRVARSSLDDDPQTTTVLERLAAARLVTLDANAVDLTHEALIRSWPRLRGWLDDNRDALRIHHQLTEATAAWESLDRDPGGLYRGARLALAREWVTPEALTVREREFLTASVDAESAELEAARRRTRRLRQLVGLLTVLLVLAVTAIGSAIRAQNQVTEQRNIAIARKADTDAESLANANPALSRQLSLAAYKLAPNAETRDHLLSSQAAPRAAQIRGMTGEMRLSLSPDGHLVAAGSAAGRELWLSDVSDLHHPRVLAKLALPDEQKLTAFANDGRTVISVGLTAVRLWDITTPSSPRELPALDSTPIEPHAVAVSPDGKIAAVTYGDNSLKLWDVTGTPRQLAHLPGLAGRPTNVAFSRDGNRIIAATGTIAQLIDVTDLGKPRLAGKLVGHRDVTWSGAFSPDGTVVATSSWDHDIRLWNVSDVDDPKEIGVLTGHTGLTWGTAFSPDGRTLATVGAGDTRLWDVTDIKRPKPITVLAGGVFTVLFTPDGQGLVIAEGSEVRLQDLRDLPLAGHGDLVSSVALRPDGKVLASGSWDKTVRLWEVTPRRERIPLATITDPGNFVRSVAFSPDGNTLAAACDDGVTRLWDVREPRAPRLIGTMITELDKETLATEFSPDGKLLAVAGATGVRLWDVASRRELTSLPGYPRQAWLALFSKDGRTLVTGGGGGPRTTRLWDVSDPARPRELDAPFDPNDGPASGAWGPDGLLTLSGALHGLRLVDAAGGRVLSSFGDEFEHVYSVAYSPDGRTLVATGDAIRVWDISDRSRPRLTGTIHGQQATSPSVVFAPDGHTVITAGNERQVRVWETSVDAVAAEVCDYQRITREQWSTHFPDIDYADPC